jgi:hypothetical protein
MFIDRQTPLYGKDLAIIQALSTKENQDRLDELQTKSVNEELTEEESLELEELSLIFHEPHKYLNWREIYELKKQVGELQSKQERRISVEQGTNRQIALAFHYMVFAGDLPKGVLDHSKNARFLKFLTGLSYHNLRKNLGSIEKGEVKGIESEREIKELLKDLNTLRSMFKDILFEKEVELIDDYIRKLNNSLIDMKE